MTKTISPGNNRLRDFALDLANRKTQAPGRGRAVLEVVAVLGLISLSGRAMVEMKDERNRTRISTDWLKASKVGWLDSYRLLLF